MKKALFIVLFLLQAFGYCQTTLKANYGDNPTQNDENSNSNIDNNSDSQNNSNNNSDSYNNNNSNYQNNNSNSGSDNNNNSGSQNNNNSNYQNNNSNLGSYNNVNQNQQQDCFPNCNVDFKTVLNERNPLWTRVQIDADCQQQIDKKRQGWIDEDTQDWNSGHLRNVACSHASGSVEYNPGACGAGGPPPCCPRTDHWYKATNAWEVFLGMCRNIKEKRRKELDDLYNSCEKNKQSGAINLFDPIYNDAVNCWKQIPQNSSSTNVLSNFTNQLDQLHAGFQAAINREAAGNELQQYVSQITDLKEKICNYKVSSVEVNKYNNLIKQGDACMNQKDYSCAASKYQDALDNAPSNISADTKNRLQNQINKSKDLSNKQQGNTNNNSSGDNNSQRQQQTQEQQRKQQEEAARQAEEARKKSLSDYNKGLNNQFDETKKKQEELAKETQAAVIAGGAAFAGLVAAGISSNTDKNFYRGHGFHLGLNLGLNAISMPTVGKNSEYSKNFNGSTYSNMKSDSSTALKNLFGVGLTGGIEIDPLLSEFISIGGFCYGTVGTNPSIWFGGGSSTSSGNSTLQTTTSFGYSNINWGLNFSLGFKTIKLLYEYSENRSHYDYSYHEAFSNQDSTASNTYTDDKFTFATANLVQIKKGIGLRLLSYQSKWSIDFIYYFYTPVDWQKQWALSPPQHLFKIRLWKQSIFKLETTVGFNINALNDNIKYNDRKDINGAYVNFSLIYCKDFFSKSYFKTK